MLMVSYLGVIVLANLSATWFGPQFAIINSFVFIGWDLTARDALHERWQGRYLWWRMLALIVAGGALSVAVNWSALPIAMASCTAFVAAGVVDTVVYQVLLRQSRLLRMNGSNVLSGLVDSVVFVALAFGSPVLWGIVLQSWVGKVLGGALWSLLIVAMRTWLGLRRVSL